MSVTASTAQLASCRRVSVVHGRGSAEVTALSDVDFDVAPGEHVALVGASGSGKTTLLHVLGGLLAPTRGEVLWRGQPLVGLQSAVRDQAAGRGSALVFQGANLFGTLTAYENVAFAIQARGEASGDTAEPEELLTLVGLADKLDALPEELSGGEAQRVAIARALAQGSELLLCDEPTGHLDADTGTRVLDLFDALRDEFGFTQVTATHNPDVAARADRTVTLADGRIVSQAALG